MTKRPNVWAQILPLTLLVAYSSSDSKASAVLDSGFCYDGPLESETWAFTNARSCEERGGVLLSRQDCAQIVGWGEEESCKVFKLNSNFRRALKELDGTSTRKSLSDSTTLERRKEIIVESKTLLSQMGFYEGEADDELNLRLYAAIERYIETVPDVDHSGFLYEDSLSRSYPTQSLIDALKASAATPSVSVVQNVPTTGNPSPEAEGSGGNDPGKKIPLEPLDRVFVVDQPTNLRAAPDVFSERLIQIPAKSSLTLMGRVPNKDWYLAETEMGLRGFVFADAITLERSEDAGTAAPSSVAEPVARDYGRYFALVIGNNDYRSFPDLRTAVKDAGAVAATLEAEYGFNVTLLTNATRTDIYGQLAKLRGEVGPADNLLVYYGGHGWLDQDVDEGYWLPVDAEEDNPANWISSSNLISEIRRSSAKHLLIVADSCFSGTLTRGITILNKTPDYRDRIAKKKARVVLTSGGLEPVLDTGGGENSVFAQAFLAVLKSNQSVLDGHELFARLRAMVVTASDQTPEYGEIRKAGHDGGDFLFVRRK
jgi:hypothetical protein